MKADEIILTLGYPFGINPQMNPTFLGWLSTRQLILRDNRPVGHWTTETPISLDGYLWLQNYAGYDAPEFYLHFSTVEYAIARAKQILENWDDDDRRPTWCC
jgi:hypothetical protein